jgi:hypothetical protein
VITRRQEMQGQVNESDRTAYIAGNMQTDAQLYRQLTDTWEHDDEIQITIDGTNYTGRVAGINTTSHTDSEHTGWDAQLFDLHKLSEARPESGNMRG